MIFTNYKMSCVIVVGIMLVIVLILIVVDAIKEKVQFKKDGYSEPSQALEKIQWSLILTSTLVMIVAGVSRWNY